MRKERIIKLALALAFSIGIYFHWLQDKYSVRSVTLGMSLGAVHARLGMPSNSFEHYTRDKGNQLTEIYPHLNIYYDNGWVSKIVGQQLELDGQLFDSPGAARKWLIENRGSQSPLGRVFEDRDWKHNTRVYIANDQEILLERLP